jgi:cytidine deaminase
VTDLRREVFVAIISPIGIDLKAVERSLRQSFRSVGYKTNNIKLTDFFDDHKDWFDLDYDGEFQRYEKFIQAGDDLCVLMKRRDTLALYGMARVFAKYPDRDKEIPRDVAHIFRQIKRVEEINTLREIYGANIIFVACHASRQQRISSLVDKLITTDRSLDRNQLEASALSIIGTDANERDNPDGQRVLDCYAHADFVLDCSSQPALTASSERLVQAFFGDPFLTPTRDEYCSFVARSASARSSDLSRQVGAAIFGEKCEIISLGCNEVPAAGGGTYWGDNSADSRDFRRGFDSNQKVRTDMLRDLLVRLQTEGWLNSDLSEVSAEVLVKKAINEESEPSGPLAKAMIADVIEYGRVLHAEMNALTDAARFQRSTIGSTLYCTTMPCHLCTKLIIAAGIKRVVYIEPYYKSLVGELYEDSVDTHEPYTSDKVAFEPHKGVTPNSFLRVFRKGRRKDSDGNAVEWDRDTAAPIFGTRYPYYVPLEANEVVAFDEALKAVATETKPKDWVRSG